MKYFEMARSKNKKKQQQLPASPSPSPPSPPPPPPQPPQTTKKKKSNATLQQAAATAASFCVRQPVAASVGVLHIAPHNAVREPSSSYEAMAGISSNWIQLQKTLGGGNATLKRKRKFEVSSEDHDAMGIDRNPTKNLAALSTDCSVTQVIAMDCEMVGVGYDGKRNLLARVSLVNSSGNVIYDKLVRPMEFVTDCRTKITGFRLNDLKRGEPFTLVQKEVSELLTGRILVGHALHNDLKVLFLSHPRKNMRDTATYEDLRSKTGRPHSLKYLADKYLGCKIQEKAHSSVEDARAAMLIYNIVKDKWEKHYVRQDGPK